MVSNRYATTDAGGTEILTRDICDALARRGHRVTWMATGSLPAAVDHRVSILQTTAQLEPDYPRRWRAQERRAASAMLARLADVDDPDVIHATHFSRHGLRFLDEPALADVPVVATLTDYTAVCPDYQLWIREREEHCSAEAQSRDCLKCLAMPPSAEGDVEAWRRRNVDWLNRRVRAFWTQTPYQAERLRDGGVKLDHLVRSEARYDIPEEWAQAPRPRRSDGYVLFAGRISPEKGLHVLLKAFEAWRGALSLLVVGPTDDKSYAARLHRRYADDSRIEWRPAVPRAKVAGLLRGARAVVIPSQWQENHPIIATEALALGVPVFCSKLSSMEHLAHHPQLHLVERPETVNAWVDTLGSIGSSQGHRQAEDRISETRQEFDRFIEEMVAVYRREIAA